MMQTSNPPLLIEDATTGTISQIKRGAIARRIFKIRHIGAASKASVNFWLETADRKSEALLSWYTFSPNPPVEIEQGDLREIELSFEVPPQAAISLYNYTLVVEALQYQGTTLRRPMQLQLIPSGQDLEIDLDPGFTLEPVTTSTQPYRLNAGEMVSITVKVENRSKLTDRFYLTCSDLSKEWFTVRYPESVAERSGFIQETEGLQLNPDTQGEIILQIQPPLYSLAGSYFPTLQLTSRNREDLLLLDVVYLELLPDQRLNALLTPPLRRIPEEPNRFDLSLTNLGNLQRQLVISGSDFDRLFRYLPQPETVPLAPGETQQIALSAHPRRWWKRPLRGKEVKVPFEVFLREQLADSPDTTAPPLSSVSSTIVWLPRPWWVSKLLWLLLLLPLLGLVGLLLYLWLKRPQPTPAPEIVMFAPDVIGRDYQEGGKPVRLDWRVNRLEQIGKLTVIRLENNAETYRKSYFFNQPGSDAALPLHLLQENKADNFCTEKPTEPTSNGVRLRLDQTHKFFSIPYPYISQETDQFKVLSCEGIITPTSKAGSYTFQLQVFPLNADQPQTTQTTDTIVVRPTQEPQILRFAPDRLIYDEVPGTPGLVRLNWQIANARRVEELQLVTLSPDGKAEGELKRYSLLNGTLPIELQAFCQLSTSLVCANFPTDVQKAGDYVFKLILQVRQTEGFTELTKQTEPVKVIAKPIRIVSFQINGQNAKENPKQTYLFNRRVNPPTIGLSWQVEGSAGTKVNLLPAPGEVPLQGAMSLSMNAPGTQTVTLRVTSPAGEQQEQSVVIQTVEIPDPSQARPSASPPAASSDTAGSADSPAGQPAPPPADRTLPTPSLPQPIELPPRPN
jgi:hypothetical protein